MELIKLETIKDITVFSQEVKRFIHDNKLWTNVQGRPYVNVEGWQFMGGMMGITANISALEELSNEKEVKYRAVAELRRGDVLVSSGVAICSNKEPGKTNFAEFAVASMAQTRAIGKAYRIYLGWIMKMAGFESTPLEEMQYEYRTTENRTSEDKKDEIVKANLPQGGTRNASVAQATEE